MNEGLSMRILWRLYLLCGNKKDFPRTVANACSLTLHWSIFPNASVSQRRRLCSVTKMLENDIDLDLYFPKPDVRGMTTLDRSAFKKIITVPAVTVKKGIIHNLVKSLKHQVIKRPGLKRVVEDAKDEDKKLVLLDPHRFSSKDSFSASELDLLQKLDINPEIIEYDLELSYENFKTEEILRAVLAEGQDVASGFSRIGHVAHMNLREHQLPYKYLIGQVIIDKNPGITSVVNKINIIDTTYRNFQMEILAGDSNMVTKVRENNINYEFDFSKVYWNPRLSTEHERIIGQLMPGDILFDVFAGVGPFAIPAAKKNCTVYANDLNPESYKWLQHNCKLNKVDRKVQTFNMDGRDFITGTVKEQLAKLMLPELEAKQSSVHIAMNLPSLAVEFLDCFQGLLDKQPGGKFLLPIVHCYGFSKDDDPTGDIHRRAESFLGSSIEECISIHLVRNVAPNKEMMCISFRVPAGVLFRKGSANRGVSDEPLSKRLRTDGDYSEERQATN